MPIGFCITTHALQAHTDSQINLQEIIDSCANLICLGVTDKTKEQCQKYDKKSLVNCTTILLSQTDKLIKNRIFYVGLQS